MAFLKTILTILLVYFGLKILFKLLKPYLFRYLAKKAGSHFEKTFGNIPKQDQSRQNEGEISIDKSPKSKKTSNNSVGEYVDYEELD